MNIEQLLEKLDTAETDEEISEIGRKILEIDPESPYAKPIFQEEGKKFIFHCASGWRSALAAKTAQDMGLKPVAHHGGGFTAWRDAGEPVEKVVPKTK